MKEYIGLDILTEETSFCIIHVMNDMNASGKILHRGKVASDPKALFEMLKEHTTCPERIVLETGTLEQNPVK